MSPGTVVVLAHGHDRPALWAHERLRARGNVAVELVLVDTLEHLGTVWAHRLGSSVPPAIDVRLTDGRRLRTGDADAVLNRMVQPPLAATALATPDDVEYARGELTAFAASWLRALAPRVLNAPTPQGLSGRWRTALHWRVLAAEAGLPLAPLTLASDAPPLPGYGAIGDGAATAAEEQGAAYVTIAGELFGADDAPDPIRAAVRRFAAASDTTILGVRFAAGWRLLDATPHPDLGLAGEPGMAALERALAA